MEQRCANCRYIELEYDAEPCRDCCHCSSGYSGRPSYWAPQIEDLTEPSEKLDVILENQNYIRLELCRMRRAIDKLVTLAVGDEE